jgi:hypothetical protein
LSLGKEKQGEEVGRGRDRERQPTGEQDNNIPPIGAQLKCLGKETRGREVRWSTHREKQPTGEQRKTHHRLEQGQGAWARRHEGTR